jgi:hypothetical protein
MAFGRGRVGREGTGSEEEEFGEGKMGALVLTCILLHPLLIHSTALALLHLKAVWDAVDECIARDIEGSQHVACKLEVAQVPRHPAWHIMCV